MSVDIAGADRSHESPCQLEESECMWTHSKDGTTWQFRAGVAKIFDSPSHFSKFEIFREPQLNTYLEGMQKKLLKITKIIFVGNI